MSEDYLRRQMEFLIRAANKPGFLCVTRLSDGEVVMENEGQRLRIKMDKPNKAIERELKF